MSLNYRPSKENHVPPVGGYMTEVSAVEERKPWLRVAVVAAVLAAVGLICLFGEVASDIWSLSSLANINANGVEDDGFDVAPVLQILSLLAFIAAVVFGALSLPRRAEGLRGRRWGVTGLIVGIVGLVLLVLWSDGYGLDLFFID